MKIRLRTIVVLTSLSVLALFLLVSCDEGSDPQARKFDIVIHERTLNFEPPEIKVKKDDVVTLVIASDEAGNFHLHGYDHEQMVGPDMNAEIKFVANLEGRFAITFHPNISQQKEKSESHSHGNGENDCEKLASLPEGSKMPVIRVSATPGSDAGEVEVLVTVENFEFSVEPMGNSVAEGHWHLYIDGEARGMFLKPEASVLVDAAGHHEIKVELVSTEHCSYGIDAMTSVMVNEGASHDNEPTHDDTAPDEDHGHSDDQEIPLGLLEVQVR